MAQPPREEQIAVQPKVTVKKHRWYLGGIASAMAACCTHPLDLLKVGLKCPTTAKLLRKRDKYVIFVFSSHVELQ